MNRFHASYGKPTNASPWRGASGRRRASHQISTRQVANRHGTYSAPCIDRRRHDPADGGHTTGHSAPIGRSPTPRVRYTTDFSISASQHLPSEHGRASTIPLRTSIRPRICSPALSCPALLPCLPAVPALSALRCTPPPPPSSLAVQHISVNQSISQPVPILRPFQRARTQAWRRIVAGACCVLISTCSSPEREPVKPVGGDTSGLNLRGRQRRRVVPTVCRAGQSHAIRRLAFAPHLTPPLATFLSP